MTSNPRKAPWWLYLDTGSFLIWALFAVYTFFHYLPAFLFWEVDPFWTPVLYGLEASYVLLARHFYVASLSTFDRFVRGELDDEL